MSCASARTLAAEVFELHGRPDDAVRFARAEIADELSFNGPSKSRAGRALGRCHAAKGEHALSVAAFDASIELAQQGRYLLSSVLSVRARAAAGREASGADGHRWSEGEGRQRS